MRKTYLDEKDLTQNCPCGYSILSFLSTIEVPNVLWSLTMVRQDSDDHNKYHATFQGYINGTYAYELCFECTITPEKHICNITHLVDKTESANCIHNA